MHRDGSAPTRPLRGPNRARWLRPVALGALLAVLGLGQLTANPRWHRGLPPPKAARTVTTPHDPLERPSMPGRRASDRRQGSGVDLVGESLPLAIGPPGSAADYAMPTLNALARSCGEATNARA